MHIHLMPLDRYVEALYLYINNLIFYLDLCNAATKIQASFRGHMSRKDQAISSVVKATEDVIGNVSSKLEQKVSL